MAILWLSRDVDTVMAAIVDARSGRPRALAVLGDAGIGKTSLLADVRRWASGFTVLEAAGEESGYREPFRVLAHLGVEDVRTPAGSWKDPRVVAQSLGERVDLLSSGGPVLILVDDLQWVDRESVDSLYWLVRRALGDRLLVVLASRSDGEGTSDAWRRLVREASPGVEPMRLFGLSQEQAAVLVRSIDPQADAATVARLREDTGGNPLYLVSLMRQYGSAELASMPMLPAPIQLATRIRGELRVLEPEVRAMVQASAVLGYRWRDVAAVAAVGDVDDAGNALDAAVESGLLDTRGADAAAAVRTPHALVRVAIYESIGYVRRRELHLRAAAYADTPMEGLEHRVAASEHYDDALAEELQQAADSAHAAGDFGQAGQLLRWSSACSSVAAARNRRWLDAAFELLLAREIASVRQQLPVIRSSPDGVRRALILGFFHGVEKRWLEAWSAYTSVTARELAEADPLTRYRLFTLSAWSVICAGRDLTELGPLLDQAATEPAVDRALVGNAIFARGMLNARRSDLVAHREGLGPIPASARATPLQLTYRLAWRGATRVIYGDAAPAEADLVEVTTRIRTGVADNSDGVYAALLAYARWQSGAWNLARVDIGIALDSAIGQPHPLTRAIVPMLLIVRGDLSAADIALREAQDVLTAMPWRQAVHLYVISYVVRLHAAGDDAEQRAGLAHLRTAFGDPVLTEFGFTGALWTVHLALAAIWAGERELAATFLDRSEGQPRLAGWMTWVSSWLRGLIAEADGSLIQARSAFDDAVRTFTNELPFYRAHVYVDQARVARAQGDRASADRSAEAARQLYAVLGAVPYLHRASPIKPTGLGSRTLESDLLNALSERERDVATLLISGLTYAQIARDLFVTRATVGFHVTRIYAKTGVTSRAGLIDITRDRPPGRQN